ncbi:MAG: PAS domain S-box protein [Candidatus Magasanikbacteria bacterium]|nr:PAS domain S-box protein [Candidatus Magasanikbacteria bacterium]
MQKIKEYSKLEIDDGYEVSSLANSFNSLMAGLNNTRDNTKKNFSNQTKELFKLQKEMERQQDALLNVLEDVEDEKNKTEAERDRINTILYSIGDAVFVVDKKLKIQMFNKAASNISGYSDKEAIGKFYGDILKFLYEKDKKINDRFIKDAIKYGKNQTLSNHTLLVRKDGSMVAVADSSSPIKNKAGRVVGCVVTFRDVTEERMVDRAKTEFVSLASHQLRTPLTAISWYGEMLLKGEVGELSEDQKVYMDKIYGSNERMIELVGALLNVSRIELGTFMVEPKICSLVGIVRGVVGELKPQIAKKDIKFSIKYDSKIPKKMKLDSKLVVVIVQNLLSNAIKYTPNKGKVTLEIKKRKNNVEIVVSDSGYGIPKKQQDQIYKKLFRADNIKVKDTEGTGLGLYIVKSILDNTDGKIWFKSAEGKGSKFFVAIPLAGMKKKVGTKRLTWYDA